MKLFKTLAISAVALAVVLPCSVWGETLRGGRKTPWQVKSLTASKLNTKEDIPAAAKPSTNLIGGEGGHSGGPLAERPLSFRRFLGSRSKSKKSKSRSKKKKKSKSKKSATNSKNSSDERKKELMRIFEEAETNSSDERKKKLMLSFLDAEPEETKKSSDSQDSPDEDESLDSQDSSDEGQPDDRTKKLKKAIRDANCGKDKKCKKKTLKEAVKKELEEIVGDVGDDDPDIKAAMKKAKKALKQTLKPGGSSEEAKQAAKDAVQELEDIKEDVEFLNKKDNLEEQLEKNKDKPEEAEKLVEDFKKLLKEEEERNFQNAKREAIEEIREAKDEVKKCEGGSRNRHLQLTQPIRPGQHRMLPTRKAARRCVEKNAEYLNAAKKNLDNIKKQRKTIEEEEENRILAAQIVKDFPKQYSNNVTPSPSHLRGEPSTDFAKAKRKKLQAQVKVNQAIAELSRKAKNFAKPTGFLAFVGGSDLARSWNNLQGELAKKEKALVDAKLEFDGLPGEGETNV